MLCWFLAVFERPKKFPAPIWHPFFGRQNLLAFISVSTRHSTKILLLILKKKKSIDFWFPRRSFSQFTAGLHRSRELIMRYYYKNEPSDHAVSLADTGPSWISFLELCLPLVIHALVIPSHSWHGVSLNKLQTDHNICSNGARLPPKVKSWSI